MRAVCVSYGAQASVVLFFESLCIQRRVMSSISSNVDPRCSVVPGLHCYDLRGGEARSTTIAIRRPVRTGSRFCHCRTSALKAARCIIDACRTTSVPAMCRLSQSPQPSDHSADIQIYLQAFQCKCAPGFCIGCPPHVVLRTSGIRAGQMLSPL